MVGDCGTKEERRKEKRKRVEGVGDGEEQGDSGRRKVDDELDGFMPASRIVHALRNPKVPLLRKIEVVGRFIGGYEEQRRQQESGVNGGVEWIAIPQFVSFLSDWVQSAIIKSCKDGGNTKQGRESLPACLNAEVWRILRWCLCSGHLGGVGCMSLSILKGVSLAFVRGAVEDGKAQDGGKGSDGADGLMEVLAEVLHILFTQHERMFRPSSEQWFSLAMSALDLEQAKGLTSVESLRAGVGPLHLLVLVVMESFARFVIWYPNPRTVYDGVVEKLLGPLFTSLASLKCGSGYPQNEGIYVWRNRYQKALEDVLREGLFHLAHMGDYADACSVLASREELLASKEDFEGKQYQGTVPKKGTGRHYQRHLFETLHNLRSGKPSVVLCSVGFLLRAYAQRLKVHSTALLQDVYGIQGKERTQAVSQNESKDHSERKDEAQGDGGKDTEGDKPEKEDAADGDSGQTGSQTDAGVVSRSQTQRLRQSEQLFAVFAELVGPLVQEVEQLFVDYPFEDVERGDVIMRRVSQLLDAVNSLLSAAKDEHVYVPTEDTRKESHLLFLRYLQDVIMKAAKLVHESSQNVGNQVFAMSAASMSRQVVLAIGHLLDLEYRVTEQHLADVWLTLLNAVAVSTSYETQDSGTRDHEPFSEVMQVACRILQMYSDLRQVDRPLLVLCSCLRTNTSGSLPYVGSHRWLVSSAVETIVASKHFLQTLAVAVRTLPEGQSSQVVRVLAADLKETIELFDTIPASTTMSLDPQSETREIVLQAAAATKGLSEIYSCVLENVNVTATNSIHVGAAVRNAVTSGISLPLGNLIDLSLKVSPQGINGEAYGSSLKQRQKRHKDWSQKSEVSSQKSAVGSRPEDDELNSSKVYFLLRTFLACRSLDRQCRSLMPPKAAKKASAEVGEPVFNVFGSSGEEVADTLKDRTFFSWIGHFSKWMPDVLTGMQERTGNKLPALAYILDYVAIQRIVDVKGQLRILEFLPSKFGTVEPSVSENDDSSEMAEAVLSFKHEVAALVAFVCRGLSSFRQSLDDFSPNSAEEDNGMCGDSASNSAVCQVSWDTIIATLKPETLLIARWRLLCLTVDVWSEYATDSMLGDFVSCLLASYLRPKTILDGVSDQPQMASVHGITTELMKDALLYEQSQLQTVFASALWERVLGHVHSLLQVSPFDQEGRQIDRQGAEHLRSTVEKIEEEFRSPSNACAQNGSVARKPLKKALRKLRKLVTGTKTDCNLVQDLEQCARLLDLLCSLPQGYFAASHTGVHVLHLAKVERFLMKTLLNIRVAVCSKHPEALSADAGHTLRSVVVRLLKIFSGCRRAFKCLSASGSSAKGTTGSEIMCKLFESQEAASWFFVSIYAATAVFVDLQKLWQGHDSASSEWEPLYALMSNSRQVMSSICGNVFYQDASSLITVSQQQDSSDVSDHTPDLKHREAMIQVAQSLHKQLQLIESCLKPAGSDFKCSRAVNPVSQKDWFRALTVLSEVSSYLGSMVSAIEDLNEKCYNSENRNLTWQAKLPSTWLQSIQKLEPLLVKYLLNLVVPISSEAVLSDSCPISGDFAKPVKLKEALNEWQEDDKTDATTDLRDCQEVDESSGDDDDDADADGLDLDTHLRKQGPGLEQKDLNAKQSDDEDEADSIAAHDKEWGMFDTCVLVPGAASSEALELQERRIEGILDGTDDLRSQCVGELYLGIAAMVRLRILCFSPCAVGSASKCFTQFGRTGKTLPPWVKVLLGAAYWLLIGAGSSIHRNEADNRRWLLGVSKFMESSCNLLSCVSPSIPLPVFSKLVKLHVSLLGALAPSKHEIRRTEGVPETGEQWKDHDPARGMEFGFRERAGASADFLGQWRHATEVSFGMLLKDSPRQHLVLGLQLVKKSVLGGSNYGSGLKAGLMEGSVGREAAGGVQCMAIVLKSITNKRRLQLLEKHSPAFLSAIFSMLSHLQRPLLKLNGVKADSQELATISAESIDAAPVVLQCLEILIKLSSRAILFPMTASQTGMALHFPALLFRPFYEACIPPDSIVQHFTIAEQQPPTSVEGGEGGVENMISVRLYTASCQLLCALLRHRTRRTGHCIALLEESVKVLLRCLVLPNWQHVPKQASRQVWTVADAKVCASWLRRVYEELREQKATLGKYAAHLLAEYLCVIAGSGGVAGGLHREVESLLRPGAFALLDACIPRDLQQLHATLADGSQRGALLSLSKDYERNFKYTGKV